MDDREFMDSLKHKQDEAEAIDSLITGWNIDVSNNVMIARHEYCLIDPKISHIDFSDESKEPEIVYF